MQEILGKVTFPHYIQTTEIRLGKWVYVVHLETARSNPSRKFSTQEEALAEAKQIVSYMR